MSKKLSEATDAEILEEMERRKEQRRIAENESIVAANAKIVGLLEPIGEAALLKALSMRTLTVSVRNDSLYYGDDSFLVGCLLNGSFIHPPKTGRAPSLGLTLDIYEP